MTVSETLHPVARPSPAAALELIKPITWFPPMWALLCGVVSAGATFGDWRMVVLGMVLAGPVVCGMSQAANDWCDRHVDAINEPHRPIPSGRLPAPWALAIALAMTAAALLLGRALGPWGFGATIVAVIAAWAYSLPPVRLKRSGWWGPGLVGLCYEGLPWFTGAALIAAAAPRPEVVIAAALYALGAHGIMTLNDFKAVRGDATTGIGSLPVTEGVETAAKVACIGMALAQAVVVAMLLVWGQPIHAAIVLALLVAQVVLMRRLMADPAGRAPWYNGTGVTLYVVGMMVTALAIRGMGA